LKNNGVAALNWTAAKTAAWIDLSATSGTLAPNDSVTVTIQVGAAANALAVGIYADNITFTNATSGNSQTRTVSLFIGQPDYFTELFGTGETNDTVNQTYTFTPFPSSSLYYVTRQPATTFPQNPNIPFNTTVNLSDDANVLVTVTGGQSVKLYGTSYTSFYIGSNGYITFGAGDIEWVESLSTHFQLPRISGLFRDLNPATGGTIKRRQLADRVVVTWVGVPEYGTTNSNNVQIEMFFDGRIRITVLGIASTKGLIGLSRGLGVPAGFAESNFSAYPPPTTFSVFLPANAPEGAGALTNEGVVSLSQPSSTVQTVTLDSSDPNSVSVPATVSVPVGQTVVAFTPTILDDGKINGLHPATITASVAGWTSGSATINVVDNESTNLAITPANVTEGGTATGSVAISGTLPSNLTVSLGSSTPSRLGVPASVVIPAGSTGVTFLETGVNNTLPDGAASVTLTASTAGFTSDSEKAMVFDDEQYDTDHDGLPDVWENAEGLNLFDNSGQQGTLGDLSGSGVPNLLKYAFGLNAQSMDLTALPVTTIETDPGNSASYLTLRYHRLLTPGPLQYQVQASSNLFDWTNSLGDFIELSPATPDPGGLTETVTVRVLPALGTPGTPMRYIRVHVFVP
jgi:hypothetical protein